MWKFPYILKDYKTPNFFKINNAGVNPAVGHIQGMSLRYFKMTFMRIDVSQSQFEKLFDVNVKAPFLLSKAVVPYMKKQGFVF